LQRLGLVVGNDAKPGIAVGAIPDGVVAHEQATEDDLAALSLATKVG